MEAGARTQSQRADVDDNRRTRKAEAITSHRLDRHQSRYDEGGVRGVDWVDFNVKAGHPLDLEREYGIVYICIVEARAIQKDTQAIIYRYRVNLEVMVRGAKM